jgi:hypothetical protein
MQLARKLISDTNGTELRASLCALPPWAGDCLNWHAYKLTIVTDYASDFDVGSESR